MLVVMVILIIISLVSRVRYSVLSWMAAVVGMNEMRAGPKFELKKPSQLVASDGTMFVVQKR